MSTLDNLFRRTHDLPMAARNISITPELLAHAQARVASGKFETVSEYFRSLVRADLEREQAGEWIEAMVTRSEASGRIDITDVGFDGILGKALATPVQQRRAG